MNPIQQLNKYYADSLIFINLAMVKWKSYKLLRRMQKRAIRGKLNEVDFADFAQQLKLENFYTQQIIEYQKLWEEEHKDLIKGG